jgi:hypothetical protein
MRNILVVIVLLAIFLGTTQASIVSAVDSKPAKSTSKKVTKTVAKKTTVKKPVKNSKVKTPTKTNKKGTSVKTASYSLATLINCTGPDSKVFKASQKDCDAINSFWNKVKSSASSHNSPSSNSSSSNNSSSNNNSNHSKPASTPTPTPVMPSISSISVLPCTSSSCWGITTVVISGTNLVSGVTVEGLDTTRAYTAANGDTQIVGGNGSTVVIADFYNLPACSTFDVKVILPNGSSTTQTAAFVSACN